MTAVRWYRTALLSEDDRTPGQERWERREKGGGVLQFDVEVFVGKALDVVALKGAPLGETRDYAAFLERTAARLYASGAPVRALERCPICEASLAGAATELRVYGVAYVRCQGCRHVMVGCQPVAAAFDEVFAESEEHSATYVDRAAMAIRMDQIVRPKLEWCLDRYARQYGSRPGRLLDVGAGGGHFLGGAADRGLEAEGFERSRVSRRFALEAFGLSLRDDDFLSAPVAEADLITFWGLLEYVSEPRAFLRRARRLVSKRGLLVVEVPRVDALGTRIQSHANAVVARHMDPTTHLNAFSDESLCTALVEEGFAPVAAWYFGMDGWETLIQAAVTLGDERAASTLAPLLPALQRAADLGRQCDDIVVAAVPVDGQGR